MRTAPRFWPRGGHTDHLARVPTRFRQQ
jgi:hypothetical protein